ncbi:MAG TPA: phosphoadenosine phosphosulfate reductase family protein, partial [Thermomonas sp.]|nr:phosphoadenosine phosphosulfate reductase family protein [Thermomonas sp.]
MNPPDPVTAAESPQALSALNRWLARLPAQERVAWAFESLAGPHALSTSFGVQSAVSLHLLTQARPELPVILVDTGYLFPETYRYADELTQRFGLNLQVI